MEPPTRELVVVAHGNRLGNQLWNAAALLAAAVHGGLRFVDISSNDYRSAGFGPIPTRWPHRSAVKAVELFRSIKGSDSPLTSRRERLAYRLVDGIPIRGALLWARLHGSPVLRPRNNRAVVLPPTSGDDVFPAEARAIYAAGWPFYNPDGLLRYGDAVRAYFAPRSLEQRERIRSRAASLRAMAGMLIGVHLRHGDYRTWLGGRFHVSEERTLEVILGVLRARGIAVEDAVVLVATDEPGSAGLAGLRCVRASGTAIEDLLLLAECDVVIGSNSTFGAFAAYYGDIPHLIVTDSDDGWLPYVSASQFFHHPGFVLNHLSGTPGHDSDSLCELWS